MAVRLPWLVDLISLVGNVVRWLIGAVLALHSVVFGSISSGGDHGIHCWGDLIRSKQLSRGTVCYAQMFSGFSGDGNSIYNIIRLLKKKYSASVFFVQISCMSIGFLRGLFRKKLTFYSLFIFILVNVRWSLNKFPDFFVWALLLIVHTLNSSPLRSNLLQLQCTRCTVPTTSESPHESHLVRACQWPTSQPLSSPQLSHNDSLWA